MIINSGELPPGPVEVDGPLIIGSGPVGLTLALYLMRQGRDVIVVESGGLNVDSSEAGDLDAEATATVLEGAKMARSRQIGGGLNLWGGQLAYLMPDEVAMQTGVGPGCASSWPIPLEEINVRFGEVARLIGEPSISLPFNFSALAGEQAGLQSCQLELVATAWLRQPKLARCIWQELSASPRVRIVHGVFADSLVADVETAAVRGLSALRRDGSRIDFTARCVVLACGTIETSRLLLQRSAVGLSQPWHRLSWLGRGFNEHLDANTAVIRPLDKRRLFDVFDPIMRDGVKYTPKLYAAASDQSRLSSAAMLVFPGNVRNSIAELAILLRGLTPKALACSASSIVAATVASAREVLPLAARYLRHKRIGTVLRGDAILRVLVEQAPQFDNRIDLSATLRDSRGVPAARIHWSKGEEEGRTFLATSWRVKRWAEINGMAKVTISPQLIADPASFAACADEGLHHAGGARMAADPSRGVVDTNLKVFGTIGLYCCGASVFPRSGFANPTWTAMALAVRLGEHLVSSETRARHP